MSAFGTNIKKIRSLRNYTQQELGDVLGLTRAAVSSYEEGRAEPKIETLLRASQIFGVSVDELINKKLTVNELSNFKVPDLETKTRNKNISAPLFPGEANWISITDAIIIDNLFTPEQILLTIQDELSPSKSQVLEAKGQLYVTGKKNIAKATVMAGTYTLPIADITSVCTVIGIYQPLSAFQNEKSTDAELNDIKRRLEALEKKLL